MGRPAWQDTDSGRAVYKAEEDRGKNFRCVFLKLDDGIEVDKDGFMQISEDEQEELPFK